MPLQPFERFADAVRRRREALGLSQTQLADRLSMSRQNVVEIEAGRRLPQLAAAARLARLLGWTLDDLGRYLPGQEGPEWVLGAPALESVPVVWTLLDGRLIITAAGHVSPPLAVDGVWDAALGLVQEMPGASDPAATLFVAGCDPLLSWLWERTPHPELRLYVFSMGSQAALQALAQGAVHLAGVHLYDPMSGSYNRAADALPFPVRRWRYLVWEAGALGQVGRPDGWAVRESGSEARALYERMRPEETGLVELGSHWDVARYVKTHPAYAGVGIRPVAAALNLPFASWAEEPFEWVTRRDAADDARIRLFEHWLRSPAVKAGLDRMPGVASYSPGQLIDPSSV